MIFTKETPAAGVGVRLGTGLRAQVHQLHSVHEQISGSPEQSPEFKIGYGHQRVQYIVLNRGSASADDVKAGKILQKLPFSGACHRCSVPLTSRKPA
tara:strand:+ start:19081 stop:19371 length:291 start_codon:yes stop_codon:yes gene_type:complete